MAPAWWWRSFWAPTPGLIGGAYLDGLMAAGEAGVGRMLEFLAAQFTRMMQLPGVTSVAGLREHGRDLLTEA